MTELNFDPDALRAKYREERDKRLRADGIAQYVELTGYYNAEGQADAKLRQGAFFFGGPTEFAELLEAWRIDGTLPGLETRRSRG